jgi:hypothetical protein
MDFLFVAGGNPPDAIGDSSGSEEAAASASIAVYYGQLGT